MVRDECGECEGVLSTLKKRILANGSIQYMHQCDACGESMSQAIQKVEAVKINRDIPNWDKGRQTEYRQKRQESRAEEKEKRVKIYTKEYYAYLKSEAWRLKRKAVIEREDNLCQGCANHHIEDVHHVTYDNVGEEFLFQLMGLCKNCHSRVHYGENFESWINGIVDRQVIIEDMGANQS